MFFWTTRPRLQSAIETGDPGHPQCLWVSENLSVSCSNVSSSLCPHGL